MLLTFTFPVLCIAEEHVNPTSRKVSQQVIQQYCENSFFTVRVLKNAKGLIEGYVLQPSIGDSPISYLDCNGDFLTSFYIFGANSEKANAMKIIDPLREEFPIEEPLDCGK